MKAIAIAVLLVFCLGCGSDVPPPKTDAESIKASQDEQQRIATGEGATPLPPPK